MIRSTLSALCKGFCIGCADLVPGVSGGTMALILGIYTRLITALKSFSPALLPLIARGEFRNIAVRTDAAFLASLAAGIGCAALFFTQIIDLPELLVTHPRRVYGFFLGLVTASAVLLAAVHVRTYTAYIAVLAGITAGLAIILGSPGATPQTLWMLFPAGALAASVMLLPGISGSFVLLLIGQYGTILTAIKQGDITAIAVFLAGVIAGFAVSSRIISAALHRAPNTVYGLMTGLLIGCAPALWPFQQHFYLHYGNTRITLSEFIAPAPAAPETFYVSACIIAGAACVFLLHVAAARFTMPDETDT